LAGVQQDINTAFGGNLNYALTTPQGQLASSEAAVISNAYAIFVYYAQQVDPAYASGRFQDAIGRFYFLERDPAEPTVLQVNCNGLPGVVIPAGTPTQNAATISDSAGNLYQCTGQVTIAANGTVVTSFACTQPGPVAVPGAEDISIYQAIPGWDSVTVASGVVGSNVESRAAFETRRQDSVAGNSFGAVGSIIGAVAQVPGVLDYYGYNNNTSGTVVVGGVSIAPYSIYVAVAGGASATIAAAILSKKGAGAPMVGNTTVTAYDNNPLYASPIPYQITYEIPTPLQILFSVTIVNGPLVPSNAATLVQNALLAAFQGTALAAAFTGSIAGTTLTVTNITAGTITIGQTLADTTGALLAGTTVTGYGTGVGGVGTYSVSASQTVASESMTSTSPPSNIVIPKARIGSTLYAIQYVPAVAALGPWAQVASLLIGSSNTASASVVGNISGNTLSVRSVTSGVLAIGQTLSDPLGLIATGTTVVGFGSGSGGTGTYQVNNPQTVAGATFTSNGTGTVITASNVTGIIGIGDVLSGSGVLAGTTIVSQLSGTAGGSGVYQTSSNISAISTTITANSVIYGSTANQSNVVVQINQIPQLSAVNISVNTT
jgi:hypothetical protein